MKKADKPSVIIITGDNTKVNLGESCSHLTTIVICILLIAVAVLAVSHYCPDLLPNFVRFLISMAIGG